MGAIDLCDDENIEYCVEEVMTVNEEVDLQKLPLDEPTLELKSLLSLLKYTFFICRKQSQ